MLFSTCRVSTKELCAINNMERQMKEQCMLWPNYIEREKERKDAGLPKPAMDPEIMNYVYLFSCLSYIESKEQCSKEIDW